MLLGKLSGSVVVALLIAALGIAVAYAGGEGGAQAFGFPLFVVCAALAFVINWVAYIPSVLAQTEKYYDLTGGITYLAVTITALALAGRLDARAWVAGALVVIWATRLASFLFLRISRDGKDGRFDEIKTQPDRFLGAWTLQGLWVVLTAACALAIITGGERQPLGWIGYLGLAIWAAGFAIEVIADRQKSAFKSDSTNRGKFITTGLWAWSRHPNYFGEIVLWSGMAILAIPILSGWQWVVLISPVFVTLLLTKVSGVPLLEERADERWGDDPEYQRYREQTPVLILRPPKGAA